MIIISALGIGVAVGMGGSYQTLEKSLNGFVSEYSYSDIIFNFDLTDEDSLKFIGSSIGVEKTESRLLSDVLLKLDDGRKFAVRAVAISNDTYQDCYVWEHFDNSDADLIEVSVDRKFALAQNLHAGDIVSGRINDEYKDFVIKEIVSYAEDLALIRDKYTWCENKDFAYFYVDEKELEDTAYFEKKNQLNICVTDTYKGHRQYIADNIERQLIRKGVDIKSIQLYEDTSVYKIIDANLSTMKNLALLSPMLFFACMLIVIWLFMSQIVNRCRRDIGILKALGFRNGKIRLLYSLITLFITIAGIVIGLGIGRALEQYASDIYQNYFALPKMIHADNIELSLLASAATILIGQIACFISTRKITKILPREAMTRSSVMNEKKSGFGKSLSSHKHIALKYSIISMLRSKKRFVFSVICIAASFTMIFVGVEFNISKDYVLNQLCGEHVKYDIQIFFSSMPGEETMNELRGHGAKNMEAVNYCDADISLNDISVSTVLCGIDRDSELCPIFDENDQRLWTAADEIILEKHLADELGAAPGDYVRVYDKDVLVSDISYHCVSRIQYMPHTLLNSLHEPDNYSIICNCADAEELADYASELSDFRYLNVTEHVKESNIDSFKTFSVAVVILIAFAVLLGFQIVYNTMQMDLFEQQKEFSVLRSLGFSVGRISLIQLFKNAAVYIVSLIVGIPMGTYFAAKTLSGMSTQVREYPFIQTLSLYLLPFAIVLVYMLISHLSVSMSIRKWNLVENVKEKE